MAVDMLYSRGVGLRTLAYLCIFRWGGGALPGHYHCFLDGAGERSFGRSVQCVVDDFGTLIDVKTRRPA